MRRREIGRGLLGPALAVAVLLATVRPAARGAGEADSDSPLPELASESTACEACGPAEETPVRYLAEAQIDSIGRGMSQVNLRLWARTDSLYRAGAFGRVGDKQAREKARVHFMLRAEIGFDYLVRLTGDGRWARADEASLVRPFGRAYANTAVFPIRFLREAWTGPTGFCMEYELGAQFDERMDVGGITTRVRADRVRAGDGSTIPTICLEMGSSLHQSVDLLYAARYCARVSRETVIDRGDTLDLVMLDPIEGMYARKAGTHRLAAVAVWRSRVTGERDPARPRVGALAYFPRIQIRLSLLPDLGLDDRRDFDVPQPVCATEWTGREPRTDWLRVKPGAIFDPWGAVGPRPALLDERFPDL